MLLAPSAAVVAALCAFAWSMYRLESEIGDLRGSLRRSRAAAVATDELERHARDVRRRAQQIQREARSRADLRRIRRRSPAR
jgi:hypothetical protein